MHREDSMLTTDKVNGTASTAEADALDSRSREVWTRELPFTNGTKAAHRLHAAFPALPKPEAARPDERPILALFCYEEAGSVVGHFVTQLAGALARRQV